MLNRKKSFFASATLATEAAEGSFRARDFRFYLELFSNWLSFHFGGEPLRVQNTQIMRYLSQLKEEGFLTESKKSSKRYFSLTRSGVTGLLLSLTDKDYTNEKEKFFFLYFFLRSYRSDLVSLSKRGKRRFPKSLELQFFELLDTKKLLENEIRNAERLLKSINARRASFQESSRLVNKYRTQQISSAEIVKRIEKEYPYELNSVKALGDLLENFPEDRRLWELGEGNLDRVRFILDPSKELINQYTLELKKLLALER